MKGQRGFTYLGVLLAIALLGLGLTAASEVWVTVARRQHIEQLDWVGQQYVQAIGSYYEATPGVVVKTFPRSLGDLVDDGRYLASRRHLRQIYVNPFTGRADWTFVTTGDGGIRGLRVAVPTEAGVVEREYVYQLQRRP